MRKQPMVKMNLNRVFAVVILLWGVCGLQPVYGINMFTWQGGSGGTGDWTSAGNWKLNGGTSSEVPSGPDDEAEIKQGESTANFSSYSGKVVISSSGAEENGTLVSKSGSLINAYNDDFTLEKGAFLSNSQNLVFGDSTITPVAVAISGGRFTWNGTSTLTPPEAGSGLSLGPLPYEHTTAASDPTAVGSVTPGTVRDPLVKGTKVSMTIRGDAEFVAGVDLVGGNLTNAAGTVFVGRGGNSAELTFMGDSQSYVGNLHIGAEGFSEDGTWGNADTALQATGDVVAKENANVRVAGQTYVGRYNGKATLTIQNDATFVAGDVHVAADKSTGTLRVEDATLKADDLIATGGAKITVAGEKANVTVSGIQFTEGGRTNTIQFESGNGFGTLTSTGTDDQLAGDYSAGMSQGLGLYNATEYTVLKSSTAAANAIAGIRWDNSEDSVWQLTDNRDDIATANEYQMKAVLNASQGSEVYVTRDSMNIIDGQDLGQSGWVKITAQKGVPYNVQMIVSENGRAANIDDLEKLASWLRGSNIGDWDLTVDEDTSSLIFSGIAALSEDDDAIIFAWDMAKLNAAGKADLNGLVATDAEGNPVFRLEGIAISNTPEPGTLMLLLLGFAWLLRYRRK